MMIGTKVISSLTIAEPSRVKSRDMNKMLCKGLEKSFTDFKAMSISTNLSDELAKGNVLSHADVGSLRLLDIDFNAPKLYAAAASCSIWICIMARGMASYARFMLANPAVWEELYISLDWHIFPWSSSQYVCFWRDLGDTIESENNWERSIMLAGAFVISYSSSRLHVAIRRSLLRSLKHSRLPRQLSGNTAANARPVTDLIVRSTAVDHKAIHLRLRNDDFPTMFRQYLLPGLSPFIVWFIFLWYLAIRSTIWSRLVRCSSFLVAFVLSHLAWCTVGLPVPSPLTKSCFVLLSFGLLILRVTAHLEVLADETSWLSGVSVFQSPCCQDGSA